MSSRWSSPTQLIDLPQPAANATALAPSSCDLFYVIGFAVIASIADSGFWVISGSYGSNISIGLAVRGQRTVDDQLTVRRQRPRHVRTDLTADTVDRLRHAVVAGDVGHPFAHVLILRADHRGAPQREDVLDSGSTTDHVEGLEADVRSELDDRLAHG